MALFKFPFISVLSCLLAVCSVASAFQPCPLLGPVFPAPTSLSTSPVILAALSDLNTALAQLVETGNSTSGPYPANDTTFSIGIFSGSPNDGPDPFFQYHHTSPALQNSTNGTHVADIDSIYRIGSISKLFTVYTMLVKLGEKYLDEPVIKFIPELADDARKNGAKDQIAHGQWQDMKLGDLASQLSGIGRDCKHIHQAQLDA